MQTTINKETLFQAIAAEQAIELTYYNDGLELLDTRSIYMLWIEPDQLQSLTLLDFALAIKQLIDKRP